MCANCHLTTIECPEGFNDLAAVKRLCANLGAEFREGQTTYGWWGNWMDDSPVPRGLFAEEEEYQRVVDMTRHQRTQYMNALLGKCEHAIHFPGHTCEVGLVRVGDKLVPVWDWASTLTSVLGCPGQEEYVCPLVQEYNLARTELIAEDLGYQWTKHRLENGTVELVVDL